MRRDQIPLLSSPSINNGQFSRPGCWILPKESLQLGVERRMSRLQRARPLEEGFSDHRKELSGVSRAVGVEKRLRSNPGRVPQRFELSTHHASPRQILGARGERWCSVGPSVLEIELMRELV